MSTPTTTPSPIAPNRPARSFWVFVPPPPLFIVSFVIGVQLGHLVPLSLVPAAWERVAIAASIASMIAAMALMIPAPLLFLRHRTTIIPHAKSRKLVTSGPYRFTRNPMYLALVLGYIGVALMMNVVWPLVLLAAPIWIMHTKVIPAEEAALTAVFGDEFRAYEERVGRWF